MKQKRTIELGDKVFFTVPAHNREGIVESIDENGYAKVKVFETETDYIQLHRYLQCPVVDLRHIDHVNTFSGTSMPWDTPGLAESLTKANKGKRWNLKCQLIPRLGTSRNSYPTQMRG